MEQRWPIKPEYKEAAITRLMRIIADPSSTKREVTAATRALLVAEKQNQDDTNLNAAAEQERNRFLDLAARLRLGAVVEGTAVERSNSDHSVASENIQADD